MTDLERRYRRLLHAYPRWYRTGREDEIVSTLVDGALVDQHHPGVAEAAYLIGHGLFVRADLSHDGVVGRVLGRAASPALASAGVLALVMFVFGEWAPWTSVVMVPDAHFGPFLTIGPVVYLAWTVAAVVSVVAKSRQREAVALSLAVTGLAVPAGLALRAGRPLLFVLMAFVGLGLPALMSPSRTHHDQQILPSLIAALLTLAVLSVVVLPVMVDHAHYTAIGYARVSFYQVGMSNLAGWVPLLMVPVLLGATAALAVRRVELAGTLVVLTAPWLALSAARRTRTELLACAMLVAVALTIAVIGALHQWQLGRNTPNPGLSG